MFKLAMGVTGGLSGAGTGWGGLEEGQAGSRCCFMHGQDDRTLKCRAVKVGVGGGDKQIAWSLGNGGSGVHLLSPENKQ